MIRDLPLDRAVMVAYEDDDRIEAPRAIVWKLLMDHLDDAKVVDIHPLIRSQTTVARSEHEAVLDRVIDVDRKMRKSRWKLTLEPPDHLRWEVVESEGPWTRGSHLDLTYSEEGKATRVRARGELAFVKLPLLSSQERAVRRALDDLRTEDVFFLRRYHY